MSSDDTVLVQIVQVLSRGLQPLTDAIESPEAFAAFMEKLGWSAVPDDGVIAALVPVGSAIAELVQDVATEADLATLLVDVAAAVTALAGLRGASFTDLGAPYDDSQFWEDLPEELLALLLAEDLETWAPRAYGLLSFVGVLKKVDVEADPARGRSAYTARVLDWGVLGRTFADPSGWFAEQYGWGGDFQHARFLDGIADLTAGLGGAVTLLPAHPSLVGSYVAPDNPDRGSMSVLSVSPYTPEFGSLAVYVKPALLVLPLPPEGDPAAPPEGLLLWPILTGAASTSIDLGPAAELTIGGNLQASPLRLQLRPSGAALEKASVAFEASLGVDIAPPSPFVLVGSAEGSRFELDGAHLGLTFSGDGSSTEVIIEAGIPAARAIIDLSSSDSFLQGVLGSTPQEFEFGAGLRWSSVSGLSFSGFAEPSIRIETDITIAKVLEVTALEVGVSVGDSDAIRLSVAAEGGLEFGPLSVVVDGVGVFLDATPRSLDDPGNFGVLDVGFGFRPPNGIGLSIEAGDAVSGGGFLALDHDKGEYTGVFEVQLFEVGVTAIGILNTQLPDGSEGWALFLSLSATFTGLQIGFGFTLNGVGGLIGVHRGLDEDALADGVRTGALDSVLFPEDPVANAAKILSDIDAVFPIAKDQFVFGPVAKLGWGTPSLIEADLGIVLQVPDPITISLLGSLGAVLPDEEAAILVLSVDVAGTLNITEATLKIDASLRGSTLAGFALTGDMALRASFRDDPSFLFSFGGFHPEFTPPAGCPELQRLGIALDTGDNLRVQLGSYFAITSNTLQFGAAAELWASAVGLTVEGGFSFDALIQFKPFGLTVGIAAYVSVRAGSVDLLGVYLSGDLSGPTPWFVAGKATFKILGVDTSFEVSATFGKGSDQGPRELVDVAELLLEELRQEDAWSALPPGADGVGVITADTEDDTLAVHPAGRLQVTQRIVPLGRRIDHYGNNRVDGADTFELSSPSLGTTPVSSEPVEDFFAAAQYWTLSEDEKLSSPSFEEMPAGVVLGDDGLEAPASSEFTVDHEVVYRDPAVRASGDERPGTITPATTRALGRALRLGASLSARTAAGLPRSTRKTGDLKVGSVGFVALKTDVGERAGGLTSEATTFYAARDAVLGAARADRRAVVPAYELELL